MTKIHLGSRIKSNLKDKPNWKNYIYKDDLKNSKRNDLYQLQRAISKASVAITRGENEYHSLLAQKLSDPSDFIMEKITNYSTLSFQ